MSASQMSWRSWEEAEQMFFELVRKNGRKTWRENGIFFVSLIVSIIAFYIFLSLENQDVIVFLKTMESDAVQKLLAMLPVFYGVSLFFLFFLVYFSGLYQLQRRKYEFGVLLMLGMKRRRLFLLLLAEDIWNSLASLLIGIPIAVFLSEMISMITSKVVGLGIIGHHFTFSPGAVLLTAAGFAGIKLAAFALLSGKMVRREILYYFQDEEGENERASGRIRNGIFLMGGLLCLGAAYAAAISGTSWSSINAMCLTVAIGIVGMFLAFYGLGPFLERVWKGRQKGLGIFTARQLTEQVSLHWKPLVISSLLFLAAFCFLGYGISAADTLSDQSTVHSADFTFYGDKGDVERALKETGADAYLEEPYEMRCALLYTDAIPFDDTEEDIKAYVHDIDFGALIDAASGLEDQDERLYLESNLTYYEEPYLIALSGYNNVLKAEGKEPLHLDADEIALYNNPQSIVTVGISGLEKILAEDPVVKIDGADYRVYGTVCTEPLVADRIISLSHSLIVPDELYEKLKSPSESSYWNVMLRKDYVEEHGMMQAVYTVNELLQDSNLEYESYLQSMGRQLFYRVASSYLTIYLAVIFLVIANTVLSVQFLMHQRRTGERVRILTFLGAGYDMLCTSAEQQVRWYFLLPLAAAVINSIFGLPSLIVGMTGSRIGSVDLTFLISGLVVIASVAVIEYVYMKAVVHLNSRLLLSLVRRTEERQESL